MKKIMLLASILAFVFTFSANAQQKITLPCGDSLIVKAQPSNETVELKKNKRPYYPPAKGVVNNFTILNINSGNNNNSPVYPQQQNNCQRCGKYECAGHDHFGYTRDDYSWLPWLMFFGLIAWIIYLATRGSSSSGTSSVTHSHTHTHSHKHEFVAPSTKPVSEKPKPVAPAVDLDKLHEKVKDTGAIVTVFADGGIRVEYLKPKPPAEGKNEN